MGSATDTVVNTTSQLVPSEEDLSALFTQMKHKTQESAEQAKDNLSHLAQNVSDTLSSIKGAFKL